MKNKNFHVKICEIAQFLTIHSFFSFGIQECQSPMHWNYYPELELDNVEK
jgi:hypothetical protein